MSALANFNGGVIIISHDERFITTVSKEVRDGLIQKKKYVINIHAALGLCRWFRL